MMDAKSLRLKAEACRDRAFSLTELLVVIATLAVLAAVVFPTFAGVQNKGGRFQCANNLRQIGMGSMIFAGENNGWLPVCTIGSANGEGTKTNYLGGVHYTRYIFSTTDATANTFVPTNAPATLGTFQNLGYLYQAGLAGNGNIFYCPAEWGAPDGAYAYSPLLTTDSTGNVRSSYFYNPRIVNPVTANILRRYQTTSQLEPHRLFAVDSIIPNNAPSETGVNPVTIEHARDHGWNVLFTDGSVQFSRLAANNNDYYNLVARELSSNFESELSWEQYDTIYNFLEQDH